MATAPNDNLFISNNGIYGTLIEGKDLDSHFEVMSESLFAQGCEINMKERIIHQLMKQGHPGTTCLVGFEVHGTIENGRQPKGISLVQECQFPFDLFHLEMTAPGCSVLALQGHNATITRFLGQIPGGGVLSRDATDLSLMKDGLYFFVKHHPANEISEQLNVTFETELSVTSQLNFIFIYILDPQPDGAASAVAASARKSTLKCIRIIPPLTSERDRPILESGTFTVAEDKTLSYTEGIEWTKDRVLRKAAKSSGFATAGAPSRRDTSYIDVSYFIQQASLSKAFNGLFTKLNRVIMLRGNCSPSYADWPGSTRRNAITRAMLQKDRLQYFELMNKVSEIFFNGFKFGLLVSYMVSQIRENQKVPTLGVGDAGAAAAAVASATGSSCSLKRESSIDVAQSDAGMAGEKGDEEEILNRLVIEILMNHMLSAFKDETISSLLPLPTLEVVKIVSSLFVDLPGPPAPDDIFQRLLTTPLGDIIPEMTGFNLVSHIDVDKIKQSPGYSDIIEQVEMIPIKAPVATPVVPSGAPRDEGGQAPPKKARHRAEKPPRGGARKTRKRRRKRKTKRKRKPKRKTKKRHRQRHRRSRK